MTTHVIPKAVAFVAIVATIAVFGVGGVHAQTVFSSPNQRTTVNGTTYSGTYNQTTGQYDYTTNPYGTNSTVRYSSTNPNINVNGTSYGGTYNSATGAYDYMVDPYANYTGPAVTNQSMTNPSMTNQPVTSPATNSTNASVGPGLPNTGLGGEAAQNWFVLVASLTAAVAGVTYLTRRAAVRMGL